MDEHLKQLLHAGRDHFARGEYEKAEALLRQLAHRDDAYADVFNMLGVIAHGKGDLEGAAKLLGRAVEINPSYTEALLHLAVTLGDLGRFEEARGVYDRIRALGAAPAGGTLDPFTRGKIANLHAAVAQAYEDARMPHAAIAEYEKALALCPDFADLRTKLGTLHRDLGDLAAARAAYEAAVAAKPDFDPARLLLGVTLLSQGDAEAARAEWRIVAAHDPGNKVAAMYLRMVEAQAKT